VIPYDLPPAFMAIFLFLYGAVLGSFLTVCVHRFPQHETVRGAWLSLVRPLSSFCDRCGTRLPAKDNIPIVGWLWLRGRCRFCRRSIPGKYPLIELANGLLFVLVYVMEVPQGRFALITESCLTTALGPANSENILGLSGIALLHWRFALHLVLVEALVVASLIDWDLMIIPDSVTLPPMVLAISASALFGKFWLVPVWIQDPSLLRSVVAFFTGVWKPIGTASAVPVWIADHPNLHALAVSVAGWLVGGGVIWGIRLVGYAALRREAMGFGDVVLMAMVGSFLGWQPTVVAIFVSACLSAALSIALLPLTRLFRWDRPIPFGPYLAVGTLLTLIGWKWIWPRVEMYFSLGVLLPVVVILFAIGLFVLLALIRLIKRALGWPLYDDDEPFDEWTSADHLFHFSGETVDRQHGQWRRDSWPGESAGRGQSQWEQWRRPR
jgi:leader peptidase (prepilin peptidase)/N-methyltransferase